MRHQERSREAGCGLGGKTCHIAKGSGIMHCSLMGGVVSKH